MSHESIPLILYGLGVALLLAVAWVDWADRTGEDSSVSRKPGGHVTTNTSSQDRANAAPLFYIQAARRHSGDTA